MYIYEKNINRKYSGIWGALKCIRKLFIIFYIYFFIIIY